MNLTEKIEELQTAMKETTNRRMYERYQAVYLSLQGYKQKEIAQITGRTTKSIYHYMKAYKEKGIDGLAMGHSPGAPRKLTPEQEQKLVETVAYKQPVDVGFPARYNWTLALVKQLIENSWGKTYTLRGVSILLHDLGLSYTRPTYTLAKADPKKQETFRNETFPTLKKTNK